MASPSGKTPQRLRYVLPALLLASLACGVRLVAQPDNASDYLRYVTFDAPGHENVLLRWPERKMPLKVFLPPPPRGWFADPADVEEVTRRAVTDWIDAAGPGLPRFEFVDTAGDADIPIMWADQSPSWSVAHCFYDINWPQRRFGVANVLITAWYRDGSQVPVDDLHKTLLHEMGHALGLGGHSPNPEDALYGWVKGPKPGDLAEGIILPNRSTGLTDRDRETLRKLYAEPIGAIQSNAKQAY